MTEHNFKEYSRQRAGPGSRVCHGWPGAVRSRGPGGSDSVTAHGRGAHNRQAAHTPQRSPGGGPARVT